MSMLAALALLGLTLFLWKRLFRYLRYFQQEVYYAGRFLKWVFEKKGFDRRGSGVLLLGVVLAILSPGVGTLALGIGYLALGLLETDPRKSGKIPLTMTVRAWRIYGVAALLLFVVAVLLFGRATLSAPSWILSEWWRVLLLVHLPPFAIVGANLLLSPFEKRIQWRYRNEAEEKLKRLKPVVIGITGSYGKTSTKNALHEVLEASLGPTFSTPKSYNSLMGVSRVIRENLSEYHRYAIFEMGAYHIGSIAKLCRLTHPTCGIVTSVGLAHLERHTEHGVEGIYRAKSELAQALPQNGILVCNGENEGCRRMAKAYPKERVFLYGVRDSSSDSAEALDCAATDLAFDADGMSFVIHWQGHQYPARSRIVGRTAVSNLLAAFTMSCALGAKPEVAAAALMGIKPVSNRLQIERAGEVTFIHDAFNSNPVGFRDALTMLRHLPVERRIVMTPGMIELGSKQEEENRAVARYGASFVDIAIVVGETNRGALVEGFQSGEGRAVQIHEVPTRSGAFDLLRTIQRGGDGILIENDLPDIYEVQERF